MKFFIEAYGCTMNQGEAGIMAEQMEERGWLRTGSIEEADILVIATCTVIGTTERRMVKRLKTLAQFDKPLIVAGCLGEIQGELVREVAPNSSIIGPLDFRNGLREVLDNIRVCRTTGTEDRTAKTSDEVVAIVPIAQGCTSNCSYCIAKLARGDLESYATESIVEHVEKGLQRRAKEIRLTALDTATYGMDSGTNIPALIQEVCGLEGDFRVRIGMANPTHMVPILDELVTAYRNEKVFRFLHLPVQSGNDGVLKRMNRGYKVEDFVDIVKTFRNIHPDLSLSTDIIAGFPGESEEEFEDSLKLIKHVRPDIVNITRFSSRPGTRAQDMEAKVVGWRVKERSRRLNLLRAEISRKNNERFVGGRESVLTVEYGNRDATVARTGAYRPVVIFEKLPLGEFFEVEIVDNGETYLIGRRL